jgi:hypothetical protein
VIVAPMPMQGIGSQTLTPSAAQRSHPRSNRAQALFLIKSERLS